jgi:hypothetical protein
VALADSQILWQARFEASTVPMAGAKQNIFKFTFSPCKITHLDKNFTFILKMM